MEQHIHFRISFAFSCTTHQEVFRFLVALPFSHSMLLAVDTEEPGWKQPDALKSASLSRHINDTDGTLLYTRSLPLY